MSYFFIAFMLLFKILIHTFIQNINTSRVTYAGLKREFVLLEIFYLPNFVYEIIHAN